MQPSELVVSVVRASVEERTDSILIDCWVNFTGDDITILCTHEQGEESLKVREILWDAFEKGATAAGEQGLYGVGQDIRDAGVTDAAKGLGPAVAEMSFEERLETYETRIMRIAKIKRLGQEAVNRPTINLGICVGSTYKEVEVNLTDRSGFNYQMLIGRSFLKGSFLIDPELSHISSAACMNAAEK